MEQRFRTLDFLCKLQVFVGALVVVGSVVFLALTINAANERGAPPMPALAQWTAAGIVVGGIFFGLSIIAAAQVYQCLMQIEVNTRPPVAALPASEKTARSMESLPPACNHPEPTPPPKLPSEGGAFSITGEPR